MYLLVTVWCCLRMRNDKICLYILGASLWVTAVYIQNVVGEIDLGAEAQRACAEAFSDWKCRAPGGTVGYLLWRCCCPAALMVSDLWDKYKWRGLAVQEYAVMHTYWRLRFHISFKTQREHLPECPCIFGVRMHISQAQDEQARKIGEFHLHALESTVYLDKP